MKHFYLSILVFVLPFFLHAQRHYKPGYVVDMKGDTIHGTINNNLGGRSPESVVIVTANENKQNYTAANAQAFGIYGQVAYKRYSINEPGAPQNGNVFLKLIVSGSNVSLLSYTDAVRTSFYITEKNGEPAELVYNENTDPGSAVAGSPYKIQLQKLTAQYQPGNQQLVDAIQTGSYTDYSLAKIVTGINGSQQSTVVSAGAKGGVRFFVGANANFITTSYSNSNTQTDNLNGAPSYHATSPQANIGADIFFDKDKQAFVLRFDLGVSGSKVSFTNNYNGGSNVTGNTYTQKLSFNTLNISLTPQVMINIYNSDSFKFYADAGISLVSEHYSNKNYENDIYYSTTNTTQTTNETNSFPPLRSMVYYVPLKVGFVINKMVDIYAGYSPKADFSSSAGNISIASSSFQAGINYLFGGK